MRAAIGVAAVLAMLGCGGGAGDDDAGGGLDAGASSDAGGGTDAGSVDAGVDLDDAGAGDEDAGPVADAGPDVQDAGGATDAGDPCERCVDATLRWELDGGFRAYDDAHEIRACREYHYERMSFGSGGATETCTDQVPCTGDVVTIAEVLDALAQPDVVGAFASAPAMYGRDRRPLDVPLTVITYGGAQLTLGSDCGGGGSGPCMPIPAGVAALRDRLFALQGERLESEPCASAISGP